MFDQDDHLAITCPMCSETCCKACFVESMEKIGAVCFACYRALDAGFLDGHRLLEYMNGAYRVYQKRLLLHRALALVPSYMFSLVEEGVLKRSDSAAYAERMLSAEKCAMETSHLSASIAQLRKEKLKLRAEMACHRNPGQKSAHEAYNEKRKALEEKIEALCEERTGLYALSNSFKRLYDKTPTAALECMFWCNVPGCRGLVVKPRLGCFVCETLHCATCHRQIGACVHVCNTEDVECARALDTRRCGICHSGSGVRFAGAAYLFCSKCRTATDIETGARIKRMAGTETKYYQERWTREGWLHVSSDWSLMAKSGRLSKLFLVDPVEEYVGWFSRLIQKKIHKLAECKEYQAIIGSWLLPVKVASTLHASMSKMDYDADLLAPIMKDYIQNNTSTELFGAAVMDAHSTQLHTRALGFIFSGYLKMIHDYVVSFAVWRPGAIDVFKIKNTLKVYVNGMQLVSVFISDVISQMGVVHPEIIRNAQREMHAPMSSDMFLTSLKIIEFLD